MPTNRYCCISLLSYIKPQQFIHLYIKVQGCISLLSYIKPQPAETGIRHVRVVYHCFPTSNRNAADECEHGGGLYIIAFLHQTATAQDTAPRPNSCISLLSYIKPQPVARIVHPGTSCISLLSYIKPQPLACRLFVVCVVYHCFPTSNRNWFITKTEKRALYIIAFLHQTATLEIGEVIDFCCISLLSYIKPQLQIIVALINNVVYHCFPTSNRNK